MSLWGTSKKKDFDDSEQQEEQQQQNGGERSRPHSSRRSEEHGSMREPTERDALLRDSRRPPHADGYLDPDDPAVSLSMIKARNNGDTDCARSHRTICGQSVSCDI